MRRRERDTKVGWLRELPTLAAYSDEELSQISSLFDEVLATSGTVLIEEGTPPRRVFLVVSGLATVSVRGKPIARVGPGEFLGEMAILDSGVRSATVTADAPMRLLATDADRFFELADHPGVARAIARALARRLRLAEGSVGLGSTKESR